MRVDLSGKVALVTGAARNIGKAIADVFADNGATVVYGDVDFQVAQESALKKPGSKAVAMDVTQADQVESVISQTVEEFGSLDILVSNAGILVAEGIEEFPSDRWRAVIDVNLFGYFLCAKHAARVMIAQRSGTIIQINSKSGKRGSYKNSAYAASKFGGIGLTQSIALELAEHDIRVNAVCPGNLLDSPLWVDSLYGQYAKKWGISQEQVRQKYIEQVPLGRGCTYEDVCNVVAFLASDQANYMTGQAINVTGGQEMR